MAEIKLNINGRDITGGEGLTILDVARENGINIPTLCHDDRVKMYGACGICVVEAEKSPRLLRACSTIAADGMVINTDTERVRKSRKTALELLLSDHVGDCRPPCALACPAQTDCQGYVGLIANREYKEALKLIKDKIPLPGSIGRVCPHPCETACRRKLVEEPISIAALKSFAADKDMTSGELYAAEVGVSSGKKVAIVGGGPGGLAAAYFLRVHGHAVTVFDAMPKMGGMLRYGIPEYRLPKAYLQREIDAIEGMGVEFKNNTRLGKDITLEQLKVEYDAVVLALGAWISAELRCKGEKLDGVVGGIDFLREVDINTKSLKGRRVAVVGGGNTAMDACRTAVRLGVEAVYNVYRRTKAEMPAEEIEIIEAEEEGVIFKNLTNPNEVIGENGHVKALRLQVMELGEPDASGRRSPVPVEGKEEILEVDTVIVAIGQKLNSAGLDGVTLTKWGTISADEHTFRTSIDGVFAIGDATNKGADIAISAIGEAKKAAIMVDKFLYGEELSYIEPFLVRTEPDEKDFLDKEKFPRTAMPHRKPEERKHDFNEVNLGFSDEAARSEALRCLECGCHDYFECRLLDLANKYNVRPDKYAGSTHVRKQPTDHPYIRRNPDKCILCGLCVRICDETVGAAALGFVDRGFDTIIKPALDIKLQETDCVSCGQCVSACPAGALTETLMIEKQVPVRELSTLTTCAFCSVGCRQKLTYTGDLLFRALPYAENGEDALLCMKGRFGFGELNKIKRLTTPMLKRGGNLEAASYNETVVFTMERLKTLQNQYGNDSVAVTISDRYTNEQAFLIRKFAQKSLGTENVFSLGKTCSAMSWVTGADESTADFDDLKNANCILLVETDIQKPHLVAGIAVRRAAGNGAKIIAVNSFDSAADELAAMRINPNGGLSLLKQLVRAALDFSEAEKFPGFDKLADALADVTVNEEAYKAFELYIGAKKSVIMFEQNRITKDAALLLANFAMLCGRLGKKGSGIIQLKPNANSQGLADLGVKSRGELRRAIADGKIKGLLVFCEDAPDFGFSSLEFLAVQDLQLTATAKRADVVFPAQSFAEVNGTFTNTVGKLQQVRASVNSPLELSDFDLLKKLAEAYGKPLGGLDEARVTQLAAAVERPRVHCELLAPEGNTLARKHSHANTNALYTSLMFFAESNGL